MENRKSWEQKEMENAILFPKQNAREVAEELREIKNSANKGENGEKTTT